MNSTELNLTEAKIIEVACLSHALSFASSFSLTSFSMQTWSMLNLCKVGLIWNVCVKLLFIKCYISVFLQCIQWTSWVWIPFANSTVERSLPVCMHSQNLWLCYCLFGCGSPSSQSLLLLSFFFFFFVYCFWCLVNVFVICGFLMLIVFNFKGAWRYINIYIYSFWISYFCACLSAKWFPSQPCA